MKSAATGPLFMAALACSSGTENPGDASAELQLEMDFELAAVPVATDVPLSSFRGPPLNVADADALCELDSSAAIRQLDVRQDGIQVGETVVVALEDGVAQGPVPEARRALDGFIQAHQVAASEASDRSCLDDDGHHPGRVLLGIEAGLPLPTVQWVLQTLLAAGFTEPSMVVDAEFSSAYSDWSRDLRPPVLSGAGLPLDSDSVGGRGVVLLDEDSWSDAARRHSGLAALGVGCVSYAWGIGTQEARMDGEGETERQSISTDGGIPVLALANGDFPPNSLQL